MAEDLRALTSPAGGSPITVTSEYKGGSIAALHVWNLGPAGTVSTSEESIGKIDNPVPGSANFTAGWFNGSLVPFRFDIGSFVMVAGSISSMPPVTATNPSVYAVSGIIANTGSISLVGFHYNGSVWSPRITNGSSLMVDIGNTGSMAITTTPLPISGTSLLVSGAG